MILYMTTNKPRCSWTMTEAQFRSFIISRLRQKTRWWKPVWEIIRKARTRRGFYKCNVCKQEVPATIKGIYKTGKKKGKPKKIKNILADHIEPIIDPVVGFVDFNSFIERAFCEEDNLQAICYKCHTKKTNEERRIWAERRAKEKRG